MSTPRPTVAAQLIAALIESTPDRVRRRLDQAPQAAAAWDWQMTADAWSVDTRGETVTLPLSHIGVVEQVRCTCLLSPRCFHVLACLTSLQVALTESAAEPSVAPAAIPAAHDAESDLVEPTPSQRASTRELANAIEQILRVGAVHAGVVVQSGLLRAVHQCRAEGLHRVAALGLRVVTGVSELRARADSSDPAQLAEDVAATLECAQHVARDAVVESFWIGAARRAQRAVHPRKLHALFAEPIMTRSGFAGAAVYFLGEDERIYSVSDVRPGNAQLARDAYQGGIEIGPLVAPAKQLARRLYLGSDMTASRDGRLGRGKGVRIVDHGPSTWQCDALQARFQRPFSEQCNAVFAQAALPADAQAADWDFLFLTGTVVGAVGAELLIQTPNELLRLAIANESPALLFRENLRMLSHAPGLRLQLIGRLNPLEPDVVMPLAIANPPVTAPVGGGTDIEPHLELPPDFVGRVCLGFDEIQSRFLIHRQASPKVMGEHLVRSAGVDPLDPLRRRWIATLLSGFASQHQRNATTLVADISSLTRRGFTTAAELLDLLASCPADKEMMVIERYLATSLYLRGCAFELARLRICGERL